MGDVYTQTDIHVGALEALAYWCFFFLLNFECYNHIHHLKFFDVPTQTILMFVSFLHDCAFIMFAYDYVELSLKCSFFISLAMCFT